jgi:nucleoid DNA-binding protein
MKKIVIFMTLALAMSTAALANPIFEDRGAEASNPFDGELASGHNGGVDILGMGAEKLSSAEDTTKPHSKYKAEIYVLKFAFNNTDADSDGDGISDLILESTEIVPTNKGQIASAVKSERKPKFKAGAELSKTVNSLDTGDLDGDGFADIAISADRNGDTVKVTASSIDKRSARTGLYQTENSMNKAELIEAMASHAGLSKADSKKALDTVGEIILGEDRDMVMPGDNVRVTEGDVNVEELELAVEKIERAR